MMKRLKLGVRTEKEKALYKKMKKYGVKEKDLEEKFIRSSGKGGQRTNKVATCVYLKHIPTGIEVKCQSERSQAINRFLARRRLMDKIEAKVEKNKTAEQQRIEKIRRQKRKRSKRAKEKMLELKKKKGEKKRLRKKPSPEDFG
ncbi:MAG: peptide chain release factor family protein [Candidatus Aminicenantaceae bacterium]